jgi:NAD(P)-dependent dehydrogenase (short-subunit alcohol dehydrogenase family)
MTQTVLVTGSTDGIGLEAAKLFVEQGLHVVLHGRSAAKLEAAEHDLRQTVSDARIDTEMADLSDLAEVDALAARLSSAYSSIDVVINNAGVFRTGAPTAEGDLDVRFMVNTIAPYHLTRRLLPSISPTGRVVNLSSAAQAPVDLQALAGRVQIEEQMAYAQSKLALTMWSMQLGDEIGNGGPVMVAVNPGSLLATKMVKEGYGIAGHDIGIGSGILARAAFGEDFATATGTYFDNDAGQFSNPHPDALDPVKRLALIEQIDTVIAARLG